MSLIARYQVFRLDIMSQWGLQTFQPAAMPETFDLIVSPRPSTERWQLAQAQSTVGDGSLYLRAESPELAVLLGGVHG